MLETINMLIALFVIGVYGLCLRGYAPLLVRRTGDFTDHVFAAITIGAIGIVLRLVYWDVVSWGMKYVDPAWWTATFQSLGGISINIIFNLLAAYAGYLLIRGKWLLIPEGERSDWSAWSAAGYPAEKCLPFRLVAKLRGKK